MPLPSTTERVLEITPSAIPSVLEITITPPHGAPLALRPLFAPPSKAEHVLDVTRPSTAPRGSWTLVRASR